MSNSPAALCFASVRVGEFAHPRPGPVDANQGLLRNPCADRANLDAGPGRGTPCGRIMLALRGGVAAERPPRQLCRDTPHKPSANAPPARGVSYLSCHAGSSSRTPPAPGPNVPLPGVEWPASGGHTGDSRSSLAHNQAGAGGVKRECVSTGRRPPRSGPLDTDAPVWSQLTTDPVTVDELPRQQRT